LTKDSLIKGTLILTLAALIARFLGVFHRIPLVHLLGDSGMGSYTIAFNLYQTLLVIATAGIPAALSKLISEKMSLGLYAQAQQIYRAAIIFSLYAGLLVSIALFFGAPLYASKISGDPQAILATRMIAPALLFFPLIAIMRGYYQGMQHMMPNGISQVIEQLLRTIVAIGLAYALIHVSLEWAVAGATLGAVAGSLAALSVMIYFSLRGRSSKPVQTDVHPQVMLKKSEIYKKLIQSSIPIVVFSVTVTFIYNLDSSMIIPFLKDQYGKSLSLDLIGIIGGRAQSLAGIPLILAIAMSQSLVPIISASHSQQNFTQVSQHISRAFQLSLLSSIPVVLFIVIAARPLDVFLFGYEDTPYGIINGPYLIALSTFFVLFQIIQQISGAVLIGIGRMKHLVWIVATGVTVKFLGNICLSPWMGIYGFLVSTGLCFIVISWLNLRLIKKEFTFEVFGKRWKPLIFSVSIVVGLGLLIMNLLEKYVHIFPDRLNQGMIATILCCSLLGVYFFLILLTKVLLPEDLAKMPRPIQKWLFKLLKVRSH
jgi:stage V sporulation protein B